MLVLEIVGEVAMSLLLELIAGENADTIDRAAAAANKVNVMKNNDFILLFQAIYTEQCAC